MLVHIINVQQTWHAAKYITDMDLIAGISTEFFSNTIPLSALHFKIAVIYRPC